MRDARIHFRECRSLLNAGFRVHLIACDDGTRPDPPVTFHALQRPRSRVVRALLTTLQAYLLAKSVNADLYHLHDPELLPVGVLLAWQGRAVVYDAHEDLTLDVLSKTWLPAKLRPLLAHLAGYAESFLVRPLAAVITPTASIAARLKMFNRNTWIVRNLPTAEFFSVAGAWDAAERFVVYAGLISRRRGIDVMLAAASRAGVTLRLMGRFEDLQTETEVRQSAYWACVDYRGRVDPEQVPALLRGAIAGLCILQPTRAFVKASPMKLLEYHAAGIPVIASDFPDWRALLGDVDCAHFVDPGSVEQVANAIVRILEKRADRNKPLLQRQTSISKSLTWEAESERLLAAYKAVLSRQTYY